MKFLLPILLIFAGFNLTWGRSLYWGPYHTHDTHLMNPWSRYDYDDELFALPSKQDSDEERDFEILSKLFDKSSEDSKETKETKTSDEADTVENLRATHFKEIESFLNSVLGDDKSEDDKKNDDKSKESTKETDDDDDEEDKTAENDNEDTDNSQEQLTVQDKDSSEEKKHLNESKESNEILTLDNSDEKDSDEKLQVPVLEIPEKDIRELTAMLMMISTLDDLMKITENTTADEEKLNEEELNEKNLKEVDEYLNLFGSLLDKILDESSEEKKDKKKSDSDEDQDDKKNNADNDDDDDKANNDDSKANDDEDASVSLEFHGLENSNSKTNLENHKYDVFQKSTATVELLKPTSSPYLPQTFPSNADNNNVIQEYVEVREKIDTLQDNLLSNKLNMDKDFYNIIANENEDKNMNKFANDITDLRDNAYKIKQTVDDMQDIKSKLYFHKLIKAALKGAQFN